MAKQMDGQMFVVKLKFYGPLMEKKMFKSLKNVIFNKFECTAIY